MSSTLLCGILDKNASLEPVNALLLALIGIAIVFVILILLMLIISLFGKVIDKTNKLSKKEEKPAATEAVQEETAPKEYAVGSCGELKLINVEDKDAAMIMAIVADELKTPLNELRFKTIKRVDEEEQK